MKLGSLFAGIGGLDLGFERAGFDVKWQVENDDYCNRVLAKHWPNVRRYGDVREVGEELEWVDCICGGFPCQDISNAGKRAGITGARSGLWTEFARIVRVVRPQYVVVENVSALLGRGMGVVLGDLAESGYDAEWGCVSAASVGAPHIRNRVFILAYARGIRCDARRTEQSLQGAGASGEARHDRPEAPDGGGADVADADHSGNRTHEGRADGLWQAAEDAGRQEPQPQSGGHGEDVADATSEQRDGCNDYGSCRPESLSQSGDGAEETRPVSSWWAVEPDVGRVAHGVPHRLDRLRALGNAVVPAVAEFVARRRLATHEWSSQ